MRQKVKYTFLDFETRSAADLKKVGADNYSKHPSTDALCVGFAFDDEPVDLLEPGDYEFAPFLEQGLVIISHNAAFELAIWNNVMVRRYGWPPLKPENMICTMAMAYAMGLPGSLANAALATGIEHQKDHAGHRVMMQLSQPRTLEPLTWWTDKEKTQKLFDYCRQDIETERALFKRLVKLSPSEKKIWELDQRINNRGIQIDRKSAQAALDLVEAEKKKLNQRMREISSGAIATCTAVAQIGQYLANRGVSIPDGIAKAEVTEILSRPDLPDDCREVLILRQEAGKSSTAKLQTMLLRAGDDGRLRGMFQYHGASTGRWAGRGVQLQNMTRGKLKIKEVEAVFDLLGEAE